MRDELDIKRILKVMYDIAKKATSRVYTTDRPEALSEKQPGFIVVSVQGGLRDRLAYGETSAKFEMYVRDTDAGLENLDLAEIYQKDIMSRLPVTIEGYKFINPIFVSIGRDGKGFHVYSITTKLIII